MKMACDLAEPILGEDLGGSVCPGISFGLYYDPSIDVLVPPLDICIQSVVCVILKSDDGWRSESLTILEMFEVEISRR